MTQRAHRPDAAPDQWTERAACAGASVNHWFPEDQVPDEHRTEYTNHPLTKEGLVIRDLHVLEACRVCHTCPVENDCLEYSLDTQQLYGIYGGRTTRQRRQILRGRAVTLRRVNHGGCDSLV